MKYLPHVAGVLAGALLTVFALAPNAASATPISWDFAAGVLQPLQSAWGAVVKVDRIQATSTTATSTFAYSVQSPCFSNNGTSCIGSGTTYTGTFPISVIGSVISFLGLSTSSPGITSGQPIYATGVNTIASVASSTFLTSIGGQASGNYITALTGDVTASGPGSVAATLATVNSNVGSFTNANITVNGKGLITAASNGASGSGGAIGTSTALANGQVDFSTSVNTIANDAAFLFDSVIKKLTVTNASTTAFSTSYASSTNAFLGNLSIGTLAGTLNANAGVVYATATTSFTPSAEFTVGGTIGALIGGANSTLTLATNGIAYSKLVQAGANTILGNLTGGTANVTAFATSSLGIAISDTTGTLAVARGGTGSTTAVSGQVIYGGGGGLTYQSVATGTISQGTGITVTGTGFSLGAGVSIANAGVLSLQQLGGGSAQTGALTFSTSSVTLNGITHGLNITNTAGAFTFTPTASGVLTVAGGGTGTTTSVANQIIYAGTNGTYQSVATSAVSCSGTVSCTAFATLGGTPITITGSASGASPIATSTNETAGSLAYWTSTSGTPALLGKVATTTLAITGPFNVPSTLGTLVGGSGSVGYWGLATTSQPSSSNILTSNGAAGVYGTATSTLSLGLGLSGTVVTVGSGQTLSVATSSLYSGTTGQIPYFNGTNAMIGTSSIFMEAHGYVGIGTTTPTKPLVVEGSTSGGIALFQRDFAAAANQSVGTFGANLNETSGIFDATGPFQTFSISNNGGPANIIGDIGAIRNGADTTGSVVIRPYSAGNPVGLFYATITGVGIASSTPTATLSVFAQNGNTLRSVFDVGSSTASATTTLFNILNNGNVGISTSTPYAGLSLGGVNLVLGASTAGGTAGDLYLPKLGTAAGTFLAADPTGKVIATTSPASAAPGGSGTEVQYRSGASTFGAIVNSAYNAAADFLGFGTTTPKWQVEIASSSPQLTLTDPTSGGTHWNLWNQLGDLWLATSSPTTFGTSTNSDGRYIKFPAKGGCDGCTDIAWYGSSGINLRNGRYVDATSTSAANAYVDIYTAPTGRRAVVTGVTFYNVSAGTITVNGGIKSAGVYNQLSASSTVVVGSPVASLVSSFVLEPGESISAIGTATGMTYRATVIEYDSDVGFYSARIFNIAATSTLVTIPVGRTATVVSPLFAGNGNPGMGTQANFTTGSFNVITFHLKADQPTAINKVNQVSVAQALPVGVGSNLVFTFVSGVPTNLNGGESLVIAPTAAPGAGTSILWTNVSQK